MNLRSFHNYLFCLLFAFLCSCRAPVQDIDGRNTDSTNEKLISVNKYLVEKDSLLIEKYIAGKQWKMNVSPTALRFEIYKHGKGKQVTAGKNASIRYRVGLPDGTLCYSSDSLGLKTFVIGKGGVESGLEEGILLMREGDCARFILPPHLAHGLSGDQDKIGPRAIIIYDVELLKIE